MNKKMPNKILLAAILLLGSTILLHARNIDPDIEIKINGLVCPSCAIGIKNGLNKTKLVKQIKSIWSRYYDNFSFFTRRNSRIDRSNKFVCNMSLNVSKFVK